jgi:carbamoyltransferase
VNRIIGINAYHADASAACIVDGQLIAAAEEERFNRIKHSAGFPAEALRYVAQAADLQRSEATTLAIARDPRARFFRKALRAIGCPGTRLTV